MSLIRLSMAQMNRRFMITSPTNHMKWFSSKSGKINEKTTILGRSNGVILSQTQIENKLDNCSANAKEYSTKLSKGTKKSQNSEEKPSDAQASSTSSSTPIEKLTSADSSGATSTTSSVSSSAPPLPVQQQTTTYSSSASSSGSNNNENSNKLWIAIAAAAIIGGGVLIYKSNSKQGYDQPVEIPKKAVIKPERRIPLTSAEIPKEVPYLLIGGGTASFAAFRAIKSHEPKAKVLVISNEIETPYMRPPLSKELWLSHLVLAPTNGNKTIPKKPIAEDTDELKFKQWNGVERSLYYEPNDFYIHPTKLNDEPNGGVAIVRGYTVDRLNVAERKAILTDGTEIKYGECLIATGSLAKDLKIFERAPLKVQGKYSLFKTIEDFKHLKDIVDKSKSIAIIGGGFLGSELSCSLAKYGESRQLKIHQIFFENGNMGKVLPEFLSKWTTERVKDEGVNVIPNAEIKDVDIQNNQLRLHLTNGDVVLCDHAIVAVGSEPNIELAKKSGLEIDNRFGGYLVNAELEARRHLYVAGDAACFYDTKLGRRRVEHHDHAVVSGRLAGENMAGLKKPYSHQSMFWSDLGPRVGYEAIGIIDSALPTVSVFAKKVDENTNTNKTNETNDSNVNLEQRNRGIPDDFSKGIVFYLRDEKIVGIVLWNVFNRINTARAIIAEDKKFDDLNEVAKLFDIHT